MSASTYEYKTVAMPQTVQGKRKRGTSEADVVAETFGEVIHLEAVEGWEYMRADILAAGTRGGMFSKEPTITYYSVLVFRRTMESAWPMHQQAQSQPPAQPQAQPEEQPQPRSQPPAQPPAQPAAQSAASPVPSPARRMPSTPVIDASPPAPSAPVRPRPAPVPPREPLPVPAAAAPETLPAAPVRPATRPLPQSGFADPTSPLAQGLTLTTGGRFRSDGGSFSEDTDVASSPASTASPRPPLGSAQD